MGSTELRNQSRGRKELEGIVLIPDLYPGTCLFAHFVLRESCVEL